MFKQDDFSNWMLCCKKLFMKRSFDESSQGPSRWARKRDVFVVLGRSELQKELPQAALERATAGAN